jgi:hypothetical protein
MGGMVQTVFNAARRTTLDRMAIGLSALCVAHCIASAVLLALLSSAGALVDSHFHEIGLMLAILLGALALGRGVMRHGLMLPASIGALGLGIMAGALTLPHDLDGMLWSNEVVWTLIGVALVALGHDLNRRAVS